MFYTGSGNDPLPVRMEISSVSRAAQGVTARKRTHWSTNIWKNKQRLSHTHTHTLTQTTTQSISVCHVLSPERGVNTNSLFSAQLSSGGFFFVCVGSFHKPITAILLENVIFTHIYPVKSPRV